MVNVCCLVLRRDPVDHEHFRAPTALPILGAICCAYLVGPWTGRDLGQYPIAGVLIGVGIVLWLVTWVINRKVYHRTSTIENVDELDSDGPRN